MSREAKIPTNSVGVAGVSPSSHPREVAIRSETVQSYTLKRRRDIGLLSARDAGESTTAKRQAVQDVVFRIVVPSKEIGKIIGQGGHRIQKVREETKATIKIADAVTRNEERVVIVSSRDVEEGVVVTDAEKALQQIVNLILQEDHKSSEAVSPGHVAVNNTIKLLIAGSQAGSLIGLSGQNVEKLRMSSGATITIFAPNQLPSCASACESDRVVQVSGETTSVLKAIDEIGTQLRENPPKEVISISPASAPIRAPHANLTPALYPSPSTGYSGYPNDFPTFKAKTTNLAADYMMFEMMIPETLVGGLIGRSGSNISRIRSESGAMVKVNGGRGEQKHRYIQFGGNAQQVTLAKQKVDECIYSQLIQQPNAHQ